MEDWVCLLSSHNKKTDFIPAIKGLWYSSKEWFIGRTGSKDKHFEDIACVFIGLSILIQKFGYKNNSVLVNQHWDFFSRPWELGSLWTMRPQERIVSGASFSITKKPIFPWEVMSEVYYCMGNEMEKEVFLIVLVSSWWMLIFHYNSILLFFLCSIWFSCWDLKTALMADINFFFLFLFPWAVFVLFIRDSPFGILFIRKLHQIHFVFLLILLGY